MGLNRRDLLLFLILGLIIAGFALYQFLRPAQLNGALISPPKVMPGIQLESDQGLVDLQGFQGKLVVLYFGYTGCPDICPLTLASLRQALDGLGAKAGQVQVIFISVDWKRDKPDNVAAYAHAFRPDFIGLTGSQAQIDAATGAYGIYYLLNLPDATGYYSVDHTASMLVLNREGQLVLTWPNGSTANEIESDLRVLLR